MSCFKKNNFSTPTSEVEEKSTSILVVGNLSKRFSNKENSRGLKDLDFIIPIGQITAIIGESGSGKSTLLRLIYGLIKVDKGTILFQGEKVKGPDEKLIPGHESMRMVSQHFDDLNTYANVWDNVASRLSNTDLRNKEKRTSEILNRLKISNLKHHRVADLSGGEKQRVAIARALITNPLLLLMDEPFNQIDSAFRDQLQSDIRQIVEDTGLTVILVSHDPSEVMGLADYLIIIQNGYVSAKGSPNELYQSPPNVYVANILAKSNILSAEQAMTLGLASHQIAIHPEWIKLCSDTKGNFRVERVIYRGFYREIIITSEALNLRVYDTSQEPWERGQKLKAQILDFVEV